MTRLHVRGLSVVSVGWPSEENVQLFFHNHGLKQVFDNIVTMSPFIVRKPVSNILSLLAASYG